MKLYDMASIPWGVAFTLMISTANPIYAVSNDRGLWFWDNLAGLSLSEIVQTPSMQDDVIATMHRWGISRVYNSYHPVALPDPSDIARWNRKLHDNNIQSHLLLGDNSWYQPAGRDWLINTVLPIQQLGPIQFVAPTDGKYDGVHLDIEPHGIGFQADWADDTPTERRDKLLGLRDTFAATRAAMDAGGHTELTLAADLPAWYDNTDGNIGWGNGTTLTAEQERDQWYNALATHLDQVTIMPFEQPSFTSIEISIRREVNYFNNDVRIGLESVEGNPWTNFNEFLAMANLIEGFYTTPTNNPNARSIGIDIQEYEQLKQFEPDPNAFAWQNTAGGTASDPANWTGTGTLDHTADLTFNLPSMSFDTAAPINLDLPESERIAVRSGQVIIDASTGHLARTVITIAEQGTDDAQARLSAGTLVASGVIQIAELTDSQGVLEVGAGGSNVELLGSRGLLVGLAGAGELHVNSDALVLLDHALKVGVEEQASGLVTVTGRSSAIGASQIRTTSAHDAFIGLRGTGEMQVHQGAQIIIDGDLHVGYSGGQGLIEVGGSSAGFDAFVRVNGQLKIAAEPDASGSGTITIQPDGRIEAADMVLLGNEFGGVGMLFVEEAGVADFPGGVTVATNGQLRMMGGQVFPAFMNVVDGRILGYGTINGPLLGRGIVAAMDGELVIGDPLDTAGIAFDGRMVVGAQSITLHDADLAELGFQTNINGGVLRAENGIAIGATESIVGYGFVVGDISAAAPQPIETTPLGIAIWPAGLQVNSSTINVYSQTATTLGSATVINGGRLFAPMGLEVDTADTLNGVGMIQADLANRGTVAPGLSLGTLTIQGNYTQTTDAQLSFQLASDTSFDQLVITASASLDGNLHVELLDDYKPDLAQMFEVMKFDAGRGTTVFSETSGLAITPQLALAPIFSGTNLILRAAIPGDVNFDNAVTVTDLSVVATYFDTSPGLYHEALELNSWEMGDFNSDGSISVADLSILATNFGLDLSAAAAPLEMSIKEIAVMMGLDLSVLPEPSVAFVIIVWITSQLNRRSDIRPCCAEL